MKITKELAFISKFLDKGILPTPFSIGEDKKYFQVSGIIYSNLVFEKDLTWLVLDKAYSVYDNKWEDLKSKIDTVIDTQLWNKISIEDINTFDLVGNVAWIEWTDHGIDITEYHNTVKLINSSQKFGIVLKYHHTGLIAFCQEWTEDVFVILKLQAIQKTLID